MGEGRECLGTLSLPRCGSWARQESAVPSRMGMLRQWEVELFQISNLAVGRELGVLR